MVFIECTQCFVEIEVPNRRTKLCKECKLQNGRDRCKRYKKENRGKIAAYNKKYKAENRDEISVYNHVYHKNNYQEIYERRQGYMKKYHEKYPIAKLHSIMRGRTACALKSKINQKDMNENVWCSPRFFKAWMKWQFQFHEGFTMENYGTKWDIDHCKPCSLFDDSEEDIYECFHWSNVRPMEPLENVSKGNKTNKWTQFIQYVRAKQFIKLHGDEFDIEEREVDILCEKFKPLINLETVS